MECILFQTEERPKRKNERGSEEEESREQVGLEERAASLSRVDHLGIFSIYSRGKMLT